MKVKTTKGFTLAELLIVMAIIVVLAAVAIPTFGRQLEASRETGDMELIRSAYTEALSMAILDATDGELNNKNGGTDIASSNSAVACANGAYTVTLESMATGASIKQTKDGWQYVNNQIAGVAAPDVSVTGGATTITFTFTISDDTVLLSTITSNGSSTGSSSTGSSSTGTP